LVVYPENHIINYAFQEVPLAEAKIITKKRKTTLKVAENDVEKKVGVSPVGRRTRKSLMIKQVILYVAINIVLSTTHTHTHLQDTMQLYSFAGKCF